jgi:hypothetical protein
VAAPSFVAAGTQFAATNATTAPLPAGWAAGHFHLVVVETSNEPMPAMSGWLNVGSGSINVASGSVTTLTARYRIAVGGDAAATIPDSGDHQVGRMFGFSGADTTSPFDGSPVFTTDSGTSSTVSFPTLTTTVADCMIVHVLVSGFDNATSQVTGAGTNAALTGLANRGNGWVATGLGGGYAVITGVKASAGAIGTTTVTHTTVNHPRALLTFALKPPAAPAVPKPAQLNFSAAVSRSYTW